jgi:hypothetical protein
MSSDEEAARSGLGDHAFNRRNILLVVRPSAPISPFGDVRFWPILLKKPQVYSPCKSAETQRLDFFNTIGPEATDLECPLFYHYRRENRLTRTSRPDVHRSTLGVAKLASLTNRRHGLRKCHRHFYLISRSSGIRTTCLA